ncbi:DUF4429 domain-containing protein [Nonomuraea sp. SYSU D8015]|uniref:DUF4429 domain-containing protein n=1 Tax=Nonomuraea sp. SYSU D8015 TaxID=2593644 RepID=UPI00166128EB|nr:DUF4429 domain-containing protein [Nonomuraea sp. SYSU D8015]
MEDVLAGRDCTWVFETDSLRVRPGPKASKLLSELGERVVPYAAIADAAIVPGKRDTVTLQVTPRRGADPVMSVAAGQLRDSADPYRLVLPAEKETLADYYAEELRSAITDPGPAERFLVAAPPVPRSFKAYDGAATFDGETVTFTWFWSGASWAKYRAGDQRFSISELEGVEWHAPEVASGSLRLKVRGRPAPSDPNKDPASVVFGLGWGAAHKSLPFAAAVLAAIPAPAPSPAELAPPAPSGAEVADLITKLGELRDAGLLSEEEFQAKKTELLSRM